MNKLPVLFLCVLVVISLGCVGSLGRTDVQVENLVLKEVRIVNNSPQIKVFAAISSNREGLWYTITYEGFEKAESYGRSLITGGNAEWLIIYPTDPNLKELPIKFCFSENQHITWPHDTEEYKSAIRSPETYCKIELLIFDPDHLVYG